MDERRESRPAGNRTAESSKGIEGISESTSDRCSVCGSRIYAVESLRTGIGQECRRRMRRGESVSRELARTRDGQRVGVEGATSTPTQVPTGVVVLPRREIVLTVGRRGWYLSPEAALDLLLDLAEVLTEDDNAAERVARVLSGGDA